MSVTLSQNEVLELAKHTIVPLQCEWRIHGGQLCTATLGSWHLLRKHLFIHCKHQASEETDQVCKLARCNMPLHGSLRALQEHVELSHMSRVALPCPVYGCASGSLMRSSQLSNHFNEYHLEIQGKTIQLPSDLFLPSWIPFLPQTKGGLPPLPRETSPGSILIGSSACSATMHDSQLDVISSQPLSPKRPRLLREDKKNSPTPQAFVYDSLEPWTCSEVDIVQDPHIVVHACQSGTMDVSKPQGMHGQILEQIFSPTIDYDEFAKKVGYAQ
ncbi:hypothetical protein AX17_003928 [Amanita inopinata Kibby_2008]|nr:hypothetical protein AX17_003928 [Amanita inopinata Kibby_2008]